MAQKKKMNMQYEGIERIGTYYHARSTSNVNYAFQGYTKNLYFTSDRTVKLNDNFQILDKDGNVDLKRVLKGYGLEIELECWTLDTNEALVHTLDKVCFEELPEHLFKYQDDGSLRGGSSSKEAITQVMTKEFIRNNYPGFKKAFDYFKLFKISATQSGNCGMHVNMSVALFGGDANKQQEAIRKFCYWINKNYKLACKMVKRNYNYTSYCRQMIQWTDMTYAKAYNLQTLTEADSSHGICFNLAHFGAGRVELRLVGGQGSYYEFRNTMEFIFHMVEACKTLSWQKMDSLIDVFKGCNQCVIKRLSDALDAGLITSAQYQEIKNNSTELELGNY